MADPRVQLSIEGAAAVIRLARPEKLNALDYDMVLALERACHDIELSDDIGVAIITGDGEKAFCAGGDIEAWGTRSPHDFGRAWVRHGHRAFDALARLRQPLIAVLNGHTLGGGLELAATADFRIAEAHIRIGQPEAGIGIIPGWSGTQRAVRRFGSQLVRRMAILGESFDAETAVKLGLADCVVAKGEGLAKAREWAEAICSRAPVAVELVKALINAAEGEETSRPLEAAAGAFAASTGDLREGIEAFRKKRKPLFKGK
jgi:enoyl-CoA hydratase/carnithine racemase